MEKPYSVEKIKAMKYPTRQDMRNAIWYLIEQLEVLKEPSNTQLKLGACANRHHCITLDNNACPGPNCNDYKRTA